MVNTDFMQSWKEEEVSFMLTSEKQKVKSKGSIKQVEVLDR